MKTPYKIPFMRASLPPLDDYVHELEDIWKTHQLTSKGSKHELLEQKLKEYCEVPYASLFVNGHLSLEAIIEAFELKGEIITTAFTFPSTAHAIVRKGCIPVFADIKDDDFTLDPKSIEACITDKTVAILPVHVLGNICDVEAIDALGKKYGLKVIYDAAHVFGVKVNGVGIGNFGDASMFSMNATKVFNTIEGGLITFKDSSLVKKLELIKYYGMEPDGDVSYVGSNLKMNEFQAAMGLVNLETLTQEIERRCKLAVIYMNDLRDLPLLTPNYKELNKYNYSYFPVLFESRTSRDKLFVHLQEKGIETKKYFSPLIIDYLIYKSNIRIELDISLDLEGRVLCLPIYSTLDETSLREICNIIGNGI